MTWRPFMHAQGRHSAADFFTTEVWTARGLVTYYTAFMLDVQSWARTSDRLRHTRTKPSSFNVYGSATVIQRGRSVA
jgi:hypothetical protein